MTVPKKYRQKSKRFRILEKEIRLLQKHLLPKSPSPTGTYPESVYTRTYSFRVLAHAELEQYFEDRVKEVCLWSIDRWRTQFKMSRSLASLLLFQKTNDAGNIQSWRQNNSFATMINSANTSLHKLVSDNHGIKEANIVPLLMNIGIDYDELDPTWLADVTSFGSRRGEVAHKSASDRRVNQLPDPFVELQTVEGLVIGIKDIDEKINNLMR